MRALRTLVIVAVVLGGLFVIADRVAVGFAEDEAADRLRSSEGLDSTPDVSIEGFPFLTQVASGELDDVRIRIKDYEASTAGSGNGAADGADTIRIAELTARLRGVVYSGDYRSATAHQAFGTARISYDELLKAAHVEPVRLMPGVTARVTGLSDGGNGKIKVDVETTGSLLGKKLTESASVLSTVKVEGGAVRMDAEELPKLPFSIAEQRVRGITDFEQKIDGLPGGIALDTVEAAEDGVDISVTGSDVQLAG